MLQKSFFEIDSFANIVLVVFGSIYDINKMHNNKKGFQLEALLWCGAGSNRRHKDFQSFALPTELPHLTH